MCVGGGRGQTTYKAYEQLLQLHAVCGRVPRGPHREDVVGASAPELYVVAPLHQRPATRSLDDLVVAWVSSACVRACVHIHA